MNTNYKFHNAINRFNINFDVVSKYRELLFFAYKLAESHF